jgi:hypothetical protein
MFSSDSINQLLQQKRVRLLLAAVCLIFAVIGLHLLLTGTNRADWLRGGGNILIWGGFAASNLARAYNRSTSGLNIPVNIGGLLLVAGWLMPS